MKSLDIFGFPVSIWIVAPVFYAVWIVVGWTAKKILFAWLTRLTQKTETQVDDIVIAAANAPITLMIFVWGATVLFHFVLPEAPAAWAKYVVAGSKIATIAAGILFIDKLLSRLLQLYSVRVEVLRISQSFTSILIHAAAFGLGALIVLDSLGISITPIIASLGIGSLAVALALQPTFENIFSGFQILLDQPIVPGQFIKLESGEEGYVDKIGWRSTWVRQISNNMVIIPNKQLVNSRVTNFYYPSKDLAVTLEVGVHYNSDLEKVERLTIAVAEEILKKVQGSVSEFKPLIRYHTFNSSSIDFTVVLRAKEVGDVPLIKHEFIKALAARYAKEGIIIPYPITALNTAQEQAVLPANSN